MQLICQSPPCCSIVKIKARYNSLPLASKVGKLASNAAKLPFQTKVVGKVVQLKGAVSRNSAKLGNYKMPVKLRET